MRGATGAASWARRRPSLLAALLYGLLSLLMFSPALGPGRTLSASDYLWTAAPWEASRPPAVPLLGSNREQTDAVTIFQPYLQLTQRTLPDVPLWTPDVMGGRPFLASPQSAVFSPFSVPAYVLPFWSSLAIMAALKLFVAAFGAYVLARVLGLRLAGALLTGLVFGFSLWAVTWVSWTTMSVWAFLPWLCALCELCVRRPGPLPFAGLAATVGLQFLAGHPSSSFQVLVVVAVIWLARILAERPFRRRAVAARVLVLGGALVVGSALAALTLIPFAELLDHSIDLQLRATTKSHQAPRYLLGIFLHDWWGHGRRSLEFASALEEHAYYVAALPLMLAGAALVRPHRVRIAVAGVGGILLAISVGLPPLFTVVAALPGFNAASNGRLAVISVLCVALLAGWGLEDLSRTASRRASTRAILVVGLLIAALPVLIAAPQVHLRGFTQALRVAWAFATPTPRLAAQAGGLSQLIHLAAVLEWVLPALAALALLVWRLRGRLSAPVFVALALALVALDLFRAGMGYNPAIPTAHARQPATRALRFLRGRAPGRFVGLQPEAPISLAVPLPPDVALRYGISDARGYDLPVEARYAQLWQQVVAPTPACNYAFCPQSAARSPRALRALSLLGVGDLLQGRRDPALHGMSLAYQGSDARVYTNPLALPRAFLATRQVVAPSSGAALSTVVSPRFPARSTVVTEAPIPGVPQGGAPGATPPGSVRLTAYRREQVGMRTDARRASVLVLTDAWYPGWKATIDGVSARIHRVDYLIRGIPVPAGIHDVELRYEPASWRVGWIVSLVTLLGVIATALVGWRGRGLRLPRRQEAPAA